MKAGSDHVAQMKAIETKLRKLPKEKIKTRFFECYGKMCEFVCELAVCIKLLKEFGDDLRGINPRIAETLLKVAAGEILPEAVWKFIASPIRNLVPNLPLADQQRLIADPVVPVVEPNPDGGYITKMVDISCEPYYVAKRVFGTNGLLSPKEQIAELKRQEVATKTARPAKGKPAASVAPSERMTLTLTSDQAKALRTLAGRLGISAEGFVMRAVENAGGFIMPRGRPRVAKPAVAARP